METLIGRIHHRGINRLLRSFIFPRLFLTNQEWTGYFRLIFNLAFRVNICPESHMHVSPQQSWIYFPNAIFYPYGNNVDIDTARENWPLNFDFVRETHTEDVFRERLCVPHNMTLEEYIGLSWEEISRIFADLRGPSR